MKYLLRSLPMFCLAPAMFAAQAPPQIFLDKSPKIVAFQSASAKPDGLPLLLGAVSMLPDAKLKQAFAPHVKPLVDNSPDPATRLAAIDALGFIPGGESESFTTLAAILQKESGDVRAAAVRSIRRIPADKWPKDTLAPLPNTIVKLVGDTPADQRATAAVVETIQLREELASTLSPEQGKPIRKSLRELGVRTVLVRTLKEQMAYDLRYFVVQAGKPVQIVLDNPDAMPHSLVVTTPGAVQEGEYGYVCTFPGHWVRMYGVMLVVPDLDVYEAKPTVPIDPLTNKPFESTKQAATDTPTEHHH